MKKADKATAYLLIKATTNSDWDYCGFAIIHIKDEWKKEQRTRIALLTPFQEDDFFSSINFYDASVEFFSICDDPAVIERILGGQAWSFVELKEEELSGFTPPEGDLDCYLLQLKANGSVNYKAYGKHTGDEFWTEDILLTQIIE